MPIKSGTITGSSTSFTILLQTLIDFVTSDPLMAGMYWTKELAERPVKDDNGIDIDYSSVYGATLQEVILSNVPTGTEKVIVGIREYLHVGSDTYNWNLNGYLSYTSGALWNSNYGDHNRNVYDSTYNNYTEHPSITLDNNTDIEYWIYADNRRIILVARTDVNFHSMYLGFGNRFADPTDYPYPLIIAGTTNGNVSHTQQTYAKFIASAVLSVAPYKMWVVSPANIYKFNVSTTIHFLPLDGWGSPSDVLRNSTTDNPVMNPIYVVNVVDNESYMSLDNVYHVASADLNIGDIITVGGDTYEVFPDINRIAYNSWMAIKQE